MVKLSLFLKDENYGAAYIPFPGKENIVAGLE